MSTGAALAVLGDPLAYTRSPELHRAGLAHLGLTGSSEALRTPPGELAHRLRDLAARAYHGVNLTAPLKQAVIPLLARVSPAAERARSVNTVGFAPDGWWGDTTDGQGFLDLLATLRRDPVRARVLFLGAGGAARSLALALAEAGAGDIAAAARDVAAAAAAWRGIPSSRIVDWEGDEVRGARTAADLLIRAVPGDVQVGNEWPRSSGALCIDLSYGPEPTPWTLTARARGLEAYDGLGLLGFQARISLSLWFSRPVPVDPLARTVGWPR